MPDDREYSLRPLLPGQSSSLDGSFRIHLKKEDMVAKKLSAGDPIVLKCLETGKSGVGIAWPSSEQGSAPFVKISHEQNQRCGFELKNKCTISRYTGEARHISSITVSEVSLSNVTAPNVQKPESPDFIEQWVRSSLAQLEAIDSKATFEVSPRRGWRKGKKLRFQIEHIEELEPSAVPQEDGGTFYVPFVFDNLTSKINIAHKGINVAACTASPRSIEFDFAGLRGLDEQLRQLRLHISKINKFIEGQNLSKTYNQPSPVLVCGPSRVGKSSVLAHVTGASWTKVIKVERKISEAALTKLFDEAIATQPSLIVLDDLNLVARRTLEPDPFTQALSREIQKLAGTQVQVIASASRPIDLHEKVLCHFRKIVQLPIPTSRSRLEILGDLLQEPPSDVLEYVGERTHAFTRDDLLSLCEEANAVAMERTERYDENVPDLSKAIITPREELSHENLLFLKEDWDAALLLVHPSLMNEAYVEVPKVHWTDIAGSDEAKEILQDAVDLSLKHPENMKRWNIQAGGGILLYGPPGCSKTLIAKAFATEAGLNFIAVKGPELISKYVGDSEYKIREVFRKARAAAPSVIFFDEIDSITPKRGDGVQEGLNTVATLLNEMDGVEDVTKVFILAATNRPETIDPALLRPGRLGTKLYIPPPNRATIEQILSICTAKMPQMGDLDLGIIAQQMDASEAMFSGADIGALCQQAAVLGEKEERTPGSRITGLQQKHLLMALEKAKPSISKDEVERLKAWSMS